MPDIIADLCVKYGSYPLSKNIMIYDLFYTEFINSN